MRTLLHLAALLACPAAMADERPNIVHIVADDLGYDEIGCFGATDIRTPNLDRLAAEGVRFTSFYSPAPLCSASRAAMMTGCYAERVGIPGALMPYSPIGLAESETTIAELLRSRGYATALVGKWHLGCHAPFLPTRHGFDHFFGLPYPNDQGPERNVDPKHAKDPIRPPIPLYRGETIIEHAAELEGLPHRFLNEALAFIAEHRDEPFYLHFANIETHVPGFIPSSHRGRSPAGAYADAVEYLDWTVGQIMAQLGHLGLADNTLVVFHSDNGPLVSRSPTYMADYGRFGTVDATRPHTLRGGKNTTWEGGSRVACIARWPAKAPAGATCDEGVASFDWFATFASLGGAELPADRVIDGRDISPLLLGEEGAKSPHEAIYYYHTFRLAGLRSGAWKLLFSSRGAGFIAPTNNPERFDKPMLFNLADDPSETTDVADRHPQVVARLMKLADRARRDLGDSDLGVVGRNVRPVGRMESTP